VRTVLKLNYSIALTKFCAKNNMYAYIVNTYVSSNFSKSLGKRNKTDISDAHMLFGYVTLMLQITITIMQ